MSLLVLILLVGMWGAVLLPGVLRDRGSSPSNQVDAFQRSLGRLAPDAGRDAVRTPTPATRSEIVQRRITALKYLAVSLASTLVLGVVVGGVLWVLPVLAALALGGYLMVLRDMAVRERSRRASSHRRAEARRKVRHLPQLEPKPARRPISMPDYLERQGA